MSCFPPPFPSSLTICMLYDYGLLYLQFTGISKVLAAVQLRLFNNCIDISSIIIFVVKNCHVLLFGRAEYVCMYECLGS